MSKKKKNQVEKEDTQSVDVKADFSFEETTEMSQDLSSEESSESQSVFFTEKLSDETQAESNEDPLSFLTKNSDQELEQVPFEMDLELLEPNDESDSLSPDDITVASPESAPMISLTDDEAVSIIESLLFISDRPVGLTTFKSAFESTNVDTKKIKELINELKIDFASSRRGVSLEEVDGAYQLRTKPDNQDFIKKILKPKIFKLTGPSLETLSIVAYKQPCVKSQVDEVRGVESGHLIRALMDKGLVAFDGKSDFPGRPMLYKTTRKFLEIFGLRNLSELPSLSEMEEILTEGIGDEDDDKPTLSQLAGSLEENFEAQSYSIGEEELGKITEQLSDISTQTEFFEIEKQKQKESRDRDRAEGLRDALILGDAIDPKDEKWLQRYGIKMNQVLSDNPMEDEDLETDELESSEKSELSSPIEAAANDFEANTLDEKFDDDSDDIESSDSEDKSTDQDPLDLL
jgi:segregation and condensation protein B